MCEIVRVELSDDVSKDSFGLLGGAARAVLSSSVQYFHTTQELAQLDADAIDRAHARFDDMAILHEPPEGLH